MFQSLEGLPILCQGLKSRLHIQALCIFTAFSLFFVGLHGPLFFIRSAFNTLEKAYLS